MLYFATASTARIRDAMTAGILGCMATPDNGLPVDGGWTWAADNGCYSAGDGWRPSRWLAFLERHQDKVGSCRFAAAPDRVGDPVETDRRWRVWRPVVAELGYRAAYVAQDGCTPPWDDLDVLFVGGTTEWKRGPGAWQVTLDAQVRGIPVHWGRVNSRRRFAMAALTGDTCDGTFLAYGPDKNLVHLTGWLNTLDLSS
jgi:hypothetical protein